MVKVNLDAEDEYLAEIREKVQEVANEELERLAKERGHKRPAAAPTTPAEALRAAIDRGFPPLDPVTAQVFRFDRAYQVKDKFDLLMLYHALVIDLALDPADIQKWIEKGTMLARLNGLQKKQASDPYLAAELVWFGEHKYIFDTLGTDADKAAADAAFVAAPEGSVLAEVSEEVVGWDKIMTDDMDARAEKGEYIAYILTRPHIDNKVIMFYSYTNQGPPDEVKTMRADEMGALSIVRTGQTYAEAVASAEEDYVEAQEQKKKREKDEQWKEQISAVGRWMTVGSVVVGVSFAAGVLAAIVSN